MLFGLILESLNLISAHSLEADRTLVISKIVPGMKVAP